MALEPFMQPIDSREISPEHVVGEHRVGTAIMSPFDADGQPNHAAAEYGIVIGFYNDSGDGPFLVGVRLLTVQQASQLAAFLLESSAHARALNAQAGAEQKEGE